MTIFATFFSFLLHHFSNGWLQDLYGSYDAMPGAPGGGLQSSYDVRIFCWKLIVFSKNLLSILIARSSLDQDKVVGTSSFLSGQMPMYNSYDSYIGPGPQNPYAGAPGMMDPYAGFNPNAGSRAPNPNYDRNACSARCLLLKFSFLFRPRYSGSRYHI